jgi:hypothetical protein
MVLPIYKSNSKRKAARSSLTKEGREMFLKRMMTVLLTAVMLIAFGVAAGSTTSSTVRAAANGQYQDRYGRFDRDDVARIAHDNGYRDGQRMGERDREFGRRFDPDNNWMFRRADTGYRFWFGNRDFYRANYRDGFTQGYQDGFSRG